MRLTKYRGWFWLAVLIRLTEGGIKIRLRGKGEGEHIIKRDTATNANLSSGRFYGRGISYDTMGFGDPGSTPGMINLYGGVGDVTIARFTLELEKGITLQGTVDKKAETTWQNGSMSKVFHYRGMVYVWGNATLVMKSGSKITGHFYSDAKYIEFSII